MQSTTMQYGSGQALGSGSGIPGRPPEAQPTREPQVVSAVNRLNSATDNIEQLISMLEQRLSGVLTPTPPDAANKLAREVMVPLAENIGTVTDRISRFGHAIESMLQRLEV